MYTTTVIEYLQVKQGKPNPTTMTTDDAAILGIAYPMRPGLLPNLDAAREGGGAQAWFDRESAEDEARRAKEKEAA